MTGTVSPTATVYVLKSAGNASDEVERLDIMHNGVKDFLGGALSSAPLEGSNPKAILELGSGSGAWAIQAAQQFPDASVLAMDLTPLPPRSNSLPENLKFQAHDLTQPFPVEPATFDIVHARFIFIHLPRPEEVLNRVIQLVKPGGWLLLEDTELMIYSERGLGPHQKAYWKAFHELQRGKGVDPFVPAAFEKLLKDSDSFSEINVHKVVVPLSGEGGDAKFNSIGPAMMASYYHGSLQVSENPLIKSISMEMGTKMGEELKDTEYDYYIHMYFAWSRKPL